MREAFIKIIMEPRGSVGTALLSDSTVVDMANCWENNDKGTYQAPKAHMPSTMANALREAYPDSSSYNQAMKNHLDGWCGNLDIKALYGVGNRQTTMRIHHRNTGLSVDQAAQKSILTTTLLNEDGVFFSICFTFFLLCADHLPELTKSVKN